MEFRPKRFIDFLSRCMNLMLVASSEYHGQDPSVNNLLFNLLLKGIFF